MTHLPFYLPSLIAVVFLAGGCSALVQKPTAAFQSATIGEVTPAGLTINFDLNVTNPNPVSIPLSSAGYHLSVGSASIVEGHTDLPNSIPARGTVPVRVPISLAFESLLNAGDAIQRSGGDIPYRFDGGLTFTLPATLGGTTVQTPLHFTGTLPLRQVLADPKLLLQSPAARKLLELIGSRLLPGT